VTGLDGRWFADSTSRDNVSIGARVRASIGYGSIEYLWDVTVKDGTGTAVNHWPLYGPNPLDDTIGSLDMTVVGSGLKKNLVHESSTSGVDSLGNTIERIRESNEFNGDESGYSIVPSNETTQITGDITWFIRGNLYGSVDSTTIVYGTYTETSTENERSWAFAKNANDSANSLRILMTSNGSSTEYVGTLDGIPDDDSVLVITKQGSTLKGYIDGVIATITNISNTPPATLHPTTNDVSICGASGGGLLSDVTLTDIKLFNRALTDSEVAVLSNQINGIENEVDESVYIPRDESNTTLDANGGLLQYKGKVPMSGKFKNAHCGTFDGVDDVVSTDNLIDIEDFQSIKVSFNTSTIDQTAYLIHQGRSGGANAKTISALWVDGTLRVQIGGNGGENVVGEVDEFLDGQWHTLEFVRTGNTVETFIDGDSYGNTIIGSIVTDNYPFCIGARHNNAIDAFSLHFDGNICDVQITMTDNQSENQHLNFSEGAGSTVYDVSGNNNHGTITNADLNTFWA
jgi:hypothetical protein